MPFDGATPSVPKVPLNVNDSWGRGYCIRCFRSLCGHLVRFLSPASSIIRNRTLWYSLEVMLWWEFASPKRMSHRMTLGFTNFSFQTDFHWFRVDFDHSLVRFERWSTSVDHTELKRVRGFRNQPEMVDQITKHVVVFGYESFSETRVEPRAALHETQIGIQCTELFFTEFHIPFISRKKDKVKVETFRSSKLLCCQERLYYVCFSFPRSAKIDHSFLTVCGIVDIDCSSISYRQRREQRSEEGMVSTCQTSS